MDFIAFWSPMQRMGKEHPHALDVPGQRTICAGGRRGNAPSGLPSRLWHSWHHQTAPIQLLSWHRKGSWRTFRFTEVWVTGLEVPQSSSQLALQSCYTEQCLVYGNFCLLVLVSCGWDAAFPTAWLPSHFQCLRMPVLILLKTPKAIFFCSSLSPRPRFSLEF